jgi:hypothetical protein
MAPVKGQRATQDSRLEPKAGQNLLVNMSEVEIGDGGEASESSKHNSLSDFKGSIPASVYVSMLNAVGEPSFRAVQTKPLPKWMKLLPSNKKTAFEQAGVATPSPEFRSYQHDLTSNVIKKPANIITDLETTAASSCLQRNDTPYPFGRAICHPILGLGISNSSSPHPVVPTSMPARKMQVNGDFSNKFPSQIASPNFSRDGALKKRSLSKDEKSMADMYKKQKPSGYGWKCCRKR